MRKLISCILLLVGGSAFGTGKITLVVNNGSGCYALPDVDNNTNIYIITMHQGGTDYPSGATSAVGPGQTYSWTWDLGTSGTYAGGLIRLTTYAYKPPGTAETGNCLFNSLQTTVPSGAFADYSVNVNLVGCGCSNLLQHTCTFSIVNNSGGSANYQLYLGASPVYGQYGGTWTALEPGQSGTLSVGPTTNACSSYSIAQLSGTTPGISVVGTNLALTPSTGTISQLMPPGSYGTTDNGTIILNPGYASATTSVYSNPASWGSNQPIAFSTNVVAGDTINTLQTGFGAVKSSIDSMHGDLGGKLDGIYGRLGTNNGSGGSGSNSYQIGSVYSTNTGNYSGMGAGTNGGSATGAAEGALGSAWTEAGDMAGAVGTTPGAGGGDGSVFTMGFVNGPINLDPGAIMPGVPAIVKGCLGWSAIVTFCFFAGRRYWDVVNAFSTSETGGVPDMEASAAGFGGNFAGFAAALIVPTVIIVAWAGVFTWLFGQAVTAMSGVNGMDPFGGMSGGALYLVNEFVPVSLVLGLLWTQLTIVLIMPKLVMLSASVNRYLFGK